MKKLICVLTAGLLAIGVHAAQAATISLLPSCLGCDTAPQGGQTSFDIVANFGADSTVGGAIDLSWDSSVMTYSTFTFDAGFGVPPRDAAFDVLEQQSASLVSIGFGNFSGISIASDTTIGTVTFDMVGAPGSSAPIQMQDSTKWGGFYSTVGAPISVSYTGSTATVAVAEVPLPAALWLFVGGFGALLGIGTKGSNTPQRRSL